MVVMGGKWEARTVVPADWLSAVFAPPLLSMMDGAWLPMVRRELALPGKREWSAQNGSARLVSASNACSFSGMEFVLVVTAGNYVTEDQARAPIAILREVFLAGLVE